MQQKHFDFGIPELKDAELAVKHAERFMRFVAKKISAPDNGQAHFFNNDGQNG